MKLAMLIVFENFRGFFWTIDLFSRKNQFRTFSELLSNNTVRDHSKKFLSKFAIFQKFKLFWKKTSFLQKIQILNVLRAPKQWHNLARILNFFLSFCVFEKLQWLFQKKPIYFLEKSQSLNVLRILEKKTQFETDSISNLTNYSILNENSSFLFQKPPAFPQQSEVGNVWVFFRHKYQLWHFLYNYCRN